MNSSRDKTNTSSSEKNQDLSTSNKADAKRSIWFIIFPKSYGQWLQLLLVIVWLVLVGYLFQQQDIRKWQVESINALQQETQQLSIELEALKITQQKNKNNGVDLSSDFLSQITKKLQSLSDDVDKNGIKTIQDGLNNILQNPAINKKILDIETTIRQLGNSLNGLQQQDNTPKPLTTKVVRQWILYINTQWQLQENSKKTLRQLNSLEMAVSRSNVKNKINIIKAIGRDIEVLNRLQKNNKNTSTAQLKIWVKHLFKINPENTPDKTTDTTDNKQRLLNKLSNLFSLRKRVDAQDLTKVEVVMLQEILMQRALLFIEQMQWGLDTRNLDILQKNIQRFESLIKRTYPNQQQELSRQLVPFKHVYFGTVPILHIVEAS